MEKRQQAYVTMFGLFCDLFTNWKKKLLIPDEMLIDYAKPVLNTICSGVG